MRELRILLQEMDGRVFEEQYRRHVEMLRRAGMVRRVSRQSFAKFLIIRGIDNLVGRRNGKKR